MTSLKEALWFPKVSSPFVFIITFFINVTTWRIKLNYKTKYSECNVLNKLGTQEQAVLAIVQESERDKDQVENNSHWPSAEITIFCLRCTMSWSTLRCGKGFFVDRSIFCWLLPLSSGGRYGEVLIRVNVWTVCRDEKLWPLSRGGHCREVAVDYTALSNSGCNV